LPVLWYLCRCFFCLKHSIKYCHYFSWKKLINLINTGFSFVLFKLFHRIFIPIKPIAVSIETTTTCNYRCPACILGSGGLKRKNEYIDFELYKKIINEIKTSAINVNLYFQGEPLMHPNIDKLILHAEENHIRTCISTNGSLLSLKVGKLIESGLSHLIVSVDGITPETYDKYRINGDFLKMCDGIRKIVKLKKSSNALHPIIEAQFIVMKHNEHEIHDFFKWANKIGFNKASLKSVQVSNTREHYLIPTIKKYSRYEIDPKLGFRTKSKLRNHCFRMFTTVVITTDGEVLPCCFDKNGKYSFGNMNVETIQNILKSDNAILFKKRVFTNRKSVDICQNCTEGLTIKY